MDDDGERYGGDRVLKVLNEVGAVDVIVVCARWFGGDMLGVSVSDADKTARGSATDDASLLWVGPWDVGLRPNASEVIVAPR